MKKRTKIRIFPFLLMGIFLLIINGFEKDEVITAKVTDIDGNVYKTVRIGSQVWMAENLKVTHYRNGDAIPNVKDEGQWELSEKGAYCNYDNSNSNGNTFGRLYNWYAVNDPRKIAPKGWHVPSNAEWRVLTAYLGDAYVAGGKLKEKGLAHWKFPNHEANNISGFNALPGGFRNFAGGFEYIFWGCGFWSSSSLNDDATVFLLDYNTSDFAEIVEGHRFGRSVRCIKD